MNIFGENEPPESMSRGDSVDGAPESVDTSSCHSANTTFKQYKIEKFYRSIKSRLIVAEVIKRFPATGDS